MNQKFDYPVVGTLELTAMDLAFINKLFAVAGHVGHHANLMKGDMELTMNMAMMVALGPHCEQMIDSLHKLHVDNLHEAGQAQRDVAMDAAQVTMGMMLTAHTGSNDISDKSEDELSEILSQIVDARAKASGCSSCKDTKCPNSTINKAGGFPNAPETGYQ